MNRIVFALLVAVSPCTAVAAGADETDVQIAGAVAPAPADQRADATVLGYDASATLVTVRQGSGQLVCIADDPSDDRYHAACYHRDLEPFMARGRELRAGGMSRDQVVATREEEIAAGELAFPDGPRALYSLTGAADVFDPATGEAPGANRVFVIYVPYATEESTGLAPKPVTDGAPWIMAPGKPWAHIMVVQSVAGEDEDGE